MASDSMRRYPPERGARVRVLFGPDRSATGTLRAKRSRWGEGTIEAEPDSPKQAGETIRVGSWRLISIRRPEA